MQQHDMSWWVPYLLMPGILAFGSLDSWALFLPSFVSSNGYFFRTNLKGSAGKDKLNFLVLRRLLGSCLNKMRISYWFQLTGFQSTYGASSVETFLGQIWDIHTVAQDSSSNLALWRGYINRLIAKFHLGMKPPCAIFAMFDRRTAVFVQRWS